MLKVGITGAIGSGKSTVAQIFKVIDIPVYNSDERAKTLMHTNQPLKQELEGRFGQDIFDESGALKRKALAQKVFNDRQALDDLNNMVHPRVREDFTEWCKTQNHHTYVLQEAALLVETGSYKSLDFLITVTAPKNTRINRIMERDEANREAVEARMNNQLPEEEKVAKSDYVIVNDGEQLVIPQVLKVDGQLRESAE